MEKALIRKKKGSVDKRFLIYLPFGLITLFFAYFANTTGQANPEAWVSMLLSMVVCFPWVYIAAALEELGINTSHYFFQIVLVSVTLNLLYFYYFERGRT